jgi:NAD(P)-dependent dehydrogenase (short-subunit alcohol dehydrogenase family)
MAHWTAADIPSQDVKAAVVTGATGGLGYEAALALARAGATVVVAGRDGRKGAAAVQRINAASPAPRASFEALDLASLAAVAAFAARIAARHPALDILVNNAGVMALPQRRATSDGFEAQLGTNYLGHFALTARLLPSLRAARARVVSVSSLAHRSGRIGFDDLQAERRYNPWRAYGQSKLAMLLFAIELQRRSDAAGWGLTSLAAHPGLARTEIVRNVTQGRGGRLKEALTGIGMTLIGQSAAQGALPLLCAATAPGVQPGGYYGPDGFGEMKGYPAPAKIAPEGRNGVAASRLWEVSEQLTGVRFGAIQGAA